MAHEGSNTLERRKMTGEVYGLRGWYRGGRCVDHLVIGEEIIVGPNARGETCVFARGREYPVDMSTLYDVRKRSRPL